MKTALLITISILTAVGHSIAVEGVSADWTKVAAANQSLMGDYQGEWSDPPKGNYYEINKPLAAQVIHVRGGVYQVHFYQEHDMRADPYFEGVGTLEGEMIRFGGNGWSGMVSKEGITGKVAPSASNSSEWSVPLPHWEQNRQRVPACCLMARTSMLGNTVTAAR